MEQVAASSIHQRRHQEPPSPSQRDRAPDSPTASNLQSPLISSATVDELVNTLASQVPVPEAPFSSFLLPHQYLCFLFPATLVLGSVFGAIGGDKSSYFSNKRNILNTLFVKNGWGWTSFFFLVYLAIVFGNNIAQQQSQQERDERSGERSQEQDHNQGDTLTRTRTRSTPPAVVSTTTPSAISSTSTTILVKALLRWFLATMYWYIISQWFFGPALFDRVFVLTGGSCSIDGHYSQYHCRRMGGQWAGGIDISGHMFLLAHAWLFLMEELSVFMNVPQAWTALQEGRNKNKKAAVLAVVGLCGLWWWMLLMTSVYYHHLMEKMTGLFFGLLFWFCSYGIVYKVIDFMPDQAVVF
ncbi:inositol phospholipid synthesis and fat-storage-inducing TM-domain-containing protein [Gamsiella multidivaricata]|uniref:inositol phospholipid synthesis and fat-storage-inducing TM-domain-containing protein n=1 Tax=Gamsiella multidivaricata TaxID=101098 RepID=UPI00222102D5|nr:inositol phospholipid synthesis and fat-storage-inducing TM-domain-containing protein [Gamsiella multidivaricata]KAG0371052.1 hypothetical protein BGZ54_000970 [Gamsiella multidivaricata]KAI7828201.1 inositol phospholipid synthesis and fat-storage-inducing TM-domain-containing protein [Gamsiella multidivaricata]